MIVVLFGLSYFVGGSDEPSQSTEESQAQSEDVDIYASKEEIAQQEADEKALKEKLTGYVFKAMKKAIPAVDESKAKVFVDALSDTNAIIGVYKDSDALSFETDDKVTQNVIKSIYNPSFDKVKDNAKCYFLAPLEGGLVINYCLNSKTGDLLSIVHQGLEIYADGKAKYWLMGPWSKELEEKQQTYYQGAAFVIMENVLQQRLDQAARNGSPAYEADCSTWGSSYKFFQHSPAAVVSTKCEIGEQEFVVDAIVNALTNTVCAMDLAGQALINDEKCIIAAKGMPINVTPLNK